MKTSDKIFRIPYKHIADWVDDDVSLSQIPGTAVVVTGAKMLRQSNKAMSLALRTDRQGRRHVR